MILSASLLLAACAASNPPYEEPIVQTVTVPPNIPIQNRPDPVDLRDVQFYVVTRDNLDEFEQRFMANNDEFVFVALSIDDYEDLALNMADIRRYIEQQGSLIVYYEQNIRALQ